MALQDRYFEDERKLSDQIEHSFDEITKTNEWVSVKFTGVEKTSFEIETRIALRPKTGEELGYYFCHTDQNGDFVDYWLVVE